VGLLKKFDYWLYRRNHDLPHPREIHELGAWDDFLKLFEENRARFRRHVEMAGRYGMGEDIKEIAASFNVTRERVRQCIMKYYRQKKSGEYKHEGLYASASSNDGDNY
jgi:hypothetical protein